MSERIIEYREALNEALHEEMERDGRVFIMGEDVGQYGGTMKVSKGLYDEIPYEISATSSRSCNGLVSVS